jgi:glycosyltransferase involved in cell wall biosynthesis
MSARSSDKSLIIYAPSVHAGGGLNLLLSLLSSSNLSVKLALFDYRAKQQFFLSADVERFYVNRSVFSRLWAECQLWWLTKPNDYVLCFHGLPPLFPLRGRVVVFLQNKILVNRSIITGYTLCTKARLLLERWILHALSFHVDKFIVQTPSMAMETKIALGKKIDVIVLPFAAKMMGFISSTPHKHFDFVYIASDEAHKNHSTLLETWRLLSDAGLKPSLALTVSAKSKLADIIEDFKNIHGLDISNLGSLNSVEISRLYNSSAALIYPSTTESFGLPLIEASQYGLPILASELDYVRDVVDPIQTFDPHSPVSIARAVRRFLGKSEPVVTISTPEDFLAEVLK